jgi:hypothetical protein
MSAEYVTLGDEVLFRRPDGETVKGNVTTVWESTFHQTDPMPTVNIQVGDELFPSVPHRSNTTSPGYYWQHV